jgi:hypothetical protein
MLKEIDDDIAGIESKTSERGAGSERDHLIPSIDEDDGRAFLQGL